jgi:hypothetical protein
MSPELEVLDQLLGSDLPLDVIAGLFPDQDHCRQSIQAMLFDGQIKIVDAEGVAIPDWRYRELQFQPDFWASGTPYRMSITDFGAERVSGARLLMETSGAV